MGAVVCVGLGQKVSWSADRLLPKKNRLDTIGCWNGKSGSAINQTVVDNRRFILMRPTLHRKNLPHRGRDSSSNSGAGFGNETFGC
jgi:hypothetical protein